MRPWDAWFRASLRDGDRPMTAEEVVRVRDAVARRIQSDPRANFRAGETGDRVVARLRQVARRAILDAGALRPSPELRQLLAAEACAQFVVRRGRYDFDALRTSRTVTYRSSRGLNQYLVRNPVPLVCEEASEFSRDLLREWTRQEASPRFRPEATVVRGHVAWAGADEWHAWNGVSIRGRDGRLMKVFYDPTPLKEPEKADWSRRRPAIGNGPLTELGLERFLASYRVYDVDVSVPDRIALRSPENLERLREDRSRFVSGWRADSPHLRPEERFWPGVPIGRDPEEEDRLTADWRRTVTGRPMR